MLLFSYMLRILWWLRSANFMQVLGVEVRLEYSEYLYSILLDFVFRSSLASYHVVDTHPLFLHFVSCELGSLWYYLFSFYLMLFMRISEVAICELREPSVSYLWTCSTLETISIETCIFLLNLLWYIRGLFMWQSGFEGF